MTALERAAEVDPEDALVLAMLSAHCIAVDRSEAR